MWPSKWTLLDFLFSPSSSISWFLSGIFSSCFPLSLYLFPWYFYWNNSLYNFDSPFLFSFIIVNYWVQLKTNYGWKLYFRNKQPIDFSVISCTMWIVSKTLEGRLGEVDLVEIPYRPWRGLMGHSEFPLGWPMGALRELVGIRASPLLPPVFSHLNTLLNIFIF